MQRRRLKGWLAVAAGAAALAFAALPFGFSELLMASAVAGVDIMPAAANPAQFLPRPGKAAGVVVDGHWRVEQIAPGTWAIGEPANDPDNYEYLLVGTRRALLIDSGATREHDLARVVAGLTPLPVTVIPSHLHYDHTNGLGHFRNIALVDLPETRARADSNQVQLGRYQYQRWSPVAFTVSEWIRPGARIDLGGRSVMVLSTPGHTTSSVSIWEPAGKRLYTGDFLYPTTLYAFVPDASLSTYVETINRLLAMLPPDARLYGAHCCRNDAPPQAPWLSASDLADTRTAIQRIEAGELESRGVIIRRFPVNQRMTMLTLYPLANR
ncbi:MBL fold metallo-hydrolase [Sandarakinorhabdus rubra]|uniref:MBL fold metallo-hydrolase n=1 Tax=Sandarakinorhabdus rubra TaxID=2672568 RepID=UPI0013DBD08A|nr:MBL fold metallo-hydrolase [Sandarakinorhabdus rubra]